MNAILAAVSVGGARERVPPAGVLAMDDEAFAPFYARTAPGLLAFLIAGARDRALAEDLMQESFLRLLRATHFAAESEEHRRRYLYRIAANLLHDRARGSGRREDQLGEDPAHEPAVAAAQPRSDVRRDLERAMAELKPRERALLWLAHVEEASHAEIAAAIRAKPASVKVMLFRARQRLAAVLKRPAVGRCGDVAMVEKGEQR